MTLDDILERYRQGRLSEDEAVERLVALGTSEADDALGENQLGLWTHQQLQPASSAYNVPLAIRLAGAVDGEAL
ncbi:hypothetical protein, partial [Xanthomonas arboricola]